MTKRDLIRKLTKSGWVITHGKAHDLATNQKKPGVKIPIPRHSGDIPIGTVKSIMRDAGIE